MHLPRRRPPFLRGGPRHISPIIPAQGKGKEPTIHATSMDVGLRQSGVSRSPPRIEAPGPALSPACRGRNCFRSPEFSQKQSPPLSTATPLRVVVSLFAEGTGPLTGAMRMLPERPGARHQRLNDLRPDLDRAAMLPRETWRHRARRTQSRGARNGDGAALPSFYGEDFFCYWRVKGVFDALESARGLGSCLTQGSAVFFRQGR